MSLKDIFDKLDDRCWPSRDGSFQWTAKGVGYGALSFYVSEEDGVVHCENELMNREFIKHLLCKMVDEAILDNPRDPGDDGYPLNASTKLPKDIV